MDILTVPQGQFQLSRFPIRAKELLRAWDAADEYILNFIAENIDTNKTVNILIVNDSHAALATALSVRHITIWSDSWLSHQAVKSNFQQNNLTLDNIQLLKSTEVPQQSFDLVLIKIPKSHALLEYQLDHIQKLAADSTKVISAGMAKQIHTSTLKLFEKYLGETSTSLAKKKARLIFTKINPLLESHSSTYPVTYQLDNSDYKIINHANVFSRDKLDIGTRFFLQHLPQSIKYQNIIDLACGNGVVGLMALKKNPDAHVLFVDESYMAVASAKETVLSNYINSYQVEFIVGDALTDIEVNSADLILNNPPFHQNNAVGDTVAWEMFKQSKHVLKNDGELWVIGNRHLGYHIKLKKLFGNCETVAANKKFVVLKAIKTK